VDDMVMVIVGSIKLRAYETCLLMIIKWSITNFKKCSSVKKMCYRRFVRLDNRYNKVLYALIGDGIGLAPPNKWMIMLDMSFLIVQRYKHVVVLLYIEKGRSITFFPLCGASSHRKWMMCLAHVNDNHFLMVYLRMAVQFLPFPCYGDNIVDKTQKNGMKDMLVGWLPLMN